MKKRDDKIDRRIDYFLGDLAEHVHLGELGDFPLFGPVRNEIVNDLDELVKKNILRREGGLYAEFKISNGDDYHRKHVDLVDSKGERLYFTDRRYAENFLRHLSEIYPERGFDLGIKRYGGDLVSR